MPQCAAPTGPADASSKFLSGPAAKGNAMAHFVTLANFTDQGLRNIKDTRKRAEAFKNAAKEFGCSVKEILWTQGQYDLVVILEAPDESAASALALSVAKLGNIRGQSLRAFTASELEKILDKVV
jgi:uncharacterized protein with GYD domain